MRDLCISVHVFASLSLDMVKLEQEFILRHLKLVKVPNEFGTLSNMDHFFRSIC